MASAGLRCQRCSQAATVHVTEMAGGVARESHFCRDCAREEGLAEALANEGQWPTDDLHTTVEVTARQLRESEKIAARFADGLEITLSAGYFALPSGPARESAFVKITPAEGSQERAVRLVRIRLVPESPEEGG